MFYEGEGMSIKEALQLGQINKVKVTFEPFNRLDEVKAIMPVVSNKLQELRLGELTDILLDYLTTPIVEDGLGTDDVQRDAWEEAVAAKWGQEGTDLIGRNRLRINILGQAYQIVDLLLSFIPEDSQKPVIQLIEEIGDRYDTTVYKLLPTEEKRKVVSLIDDTLVTILQIIANL